MNFHAAYPGLELDQAIADILGFKGKIAPEGDAFAGEYVIEAGDGIELFYGPQLTSPNSQGEIPKRWYRFRPSTYVEDAIAVGKKLNLFMQVVIWQDYNDPFDFIADYGRLGPKVGGGAAAFVRAPTLELLICRTVGVLHWRNTAGAIASGEKKAEPAKEKMSEGGIVLP